MKFDWDAAKAEANFKKHGVKFSHAVMVFYDVRALKIPDPYPDEVRHLALGMDGLARLVVVAYTVRGENIRIISARKANRHEVKHYGG